ncbi:hypothetical protein ASPWEDRAFT_49377 [Aspergillus wentii DTO 134E9]|uniref:DUF676 domain-containing protein n=1 Tax=Aspergillus wentii DTO 134E9 TaxID=1073089 RepID=A0A1L9RWR7_ASPWE|nr:uncharacterized protein ASPWEDRAFT_49377 [Aspergillus wentii DTO 134E9]KAI9928949.1 hypothetical protein MW887_001342 [Aspergillus wentii]OJJ39365.1 hypothetical protein ASPWEDRAFT_49377 [Aspergillus wentii DTO 134E9]
MDLDVRQPETPPKANHLCVLVHGLWGNPTHLDYVSTSLRQRYSEDRLYILAAKRNAGNFTYDGIELGGERLAHEIEETLEELTAKGYDIKKFSIVGYSLGGLVARYALGLLNARGWLDKLEPVNFTTFVSPHVGVRTPLKGFQNHIWNVLGARSVSMSGRQLFMIDSFRDTNKPLLSVLADPGSIFIQALAKFQNRCAYANIVNDRSAVFYTTGISSVDPFKNLDDINLNYIKGYEPVVVDSDVYSLPPETKEPTLPVSGIGQKALKILTNLPFWLFIIFFVPIGAILFLLNAAVQTFRSRKRIRLHEEGKTDVFFGGYKVPVIVQDVRHAMEDVFENVNARQHAEYLSASTNSARRRTPVSTSEKANTIQIKTKALAQEPTSAGDSLSTSPASPTEICSGDEEDILALTPAQFAIIDSLNSVGFRKYPVYIHKHRHSHAAIIVRMPKKGFEEGQVVIKHWLDNEFKI